jgi:hypothetical protein
MLKLNIDIIEFASQAKKYKMINLNKISHL